MDLLSCCSCLLILISPCCPPGSSSLAVRRMDGIESRNVASRGKGGRKWLVLLSPVTRPQYTHRQTEAAKVEDSQSECVCEKAGERMDREEALVLGKTLITKWERMEETVKCLRQKSSSSLFPGLLIAIIVRLIFSSFSSSLQLKDRRRQRVRGLFSSCCHSSLAGGLICRTRT